MRSVAVVLGLLVSSSAWAGGGFGFTLDAAGAPSVKPWSNEFDAPGTLMCFGNVAWGRVGGSRIGGETNMCLGRPGVTQGNVGLQAGSFYDLGDHGLYLSPYVSLGLGVKWAQVTVGFLFPYHPTVGARVTVPVWKGREVLGSARIGLPVSAARSDGSTWKGLPVADLWAGIGWRFDVPTR